MILEKLSNKVNPKKNTHRSTWKDEIQKIPDKIGNIGVGEEVRVEGENERRRGGASRTLGNGIVEMEEGQR